jgi:hypothetical protein
MKGARVHRQVTAVVVQTYGTGRNKRVIDACVLVTPDLDRTFYSMGRAIRNSNSVAYLLRRLMVALGSPGEVRTFWPMRVRVVLLATCSLHPPKVP